MIFLKNTKLGTKFTLALLLFFMGGTLLSWLALSRALAQFAEDQVNAKSEILIGTMNAVRNYTSTHVNPLLAPQLETEETFIPESVPAFSAREVFETFRGSDEFSTFFYKEATLNPTNLRNLADDFETEIVMEFRSDPSLTELSGFRMLEGQEVFYTARPLAVGSESCLRCHGEPEQAPNSLINTYGSENGFGWELNEIIAAQVIYVPGERVSDATWLSLSVVMLVFILIFALVVLAINLLLRRNVVDPIGRLAALAELVGDDRMSEEGNEFERLIPVAKRGDELGQLSKVFQQMARQVYVREKELKKQVHQLSIQINEVKKAEDVAEITESEYFQELQSKANSMREKRKSR
jgi:methyl-accepting chemotaxis protein